MLSSWLLDETWIAGALNAANQVDTVSIDIFDTALTRVLYSPEDIFAEVERRLCAMGLPASDFAQFRRQAEHDARDLQRRMNDREDITYEQIYAQLGYASALAHSTVTIGKALELAIEKEFLVASPDILEFTRRLATLGKPYVFVSDMYLPDAFLAGVLEENGYSSWARVFVSSAYNATKWSGALWPIVRRDYGTLLHVGDDDVADVSAPMRLGVQTRPYFRCRSFRRAAPCVSPSRLPLSRAQRSSELALRAAPASEPPPAAFMRMLGETFGAIIVGTFVRWLDQRARLHHVDRLYFFSRDGWLLHNAWRAAGYSGKHTDGRYLFAARRPFNLAAGYLGSASDYIDDATMEFVTSSSHGSTFETALTRLGVDSSVFDAARRAYGDLKRQRLGRRNQERLMAFIRDNSRSIYPLLARAHSNTMAYLNQEDVFSGGRVGVVDIGWNGRLQRSLKTLSQPICNDFELTGFYYGLWPGASRNRYIAGSMEAAFTNEFHSAKEQYFMASGSEILEAFHSAPHGSVRGYEYEGTRWTADFSPFESERLQFDKYTRHFQDGVIAALEGIFHNDGHLGIHVDDLRVENAKAAISALVLSPSPLELDILSLLGHSSGFDHNVFLPLIPTDRAATRASRQRSLESCTWKLGLLRRWSANADRRTRKQIGELARDTLPMLDHSILHQFN